MPTKKRKVKSYEEFDFEDLCVYAGIDNIVTSDLCRALMPEMVAKPAYASFRNGKRSIINAPSVWEEQLKVKAAALEFTADMEVVGMAYDIPGNRIMDKQMAEDIGQTRDRIFSAIGKQVDLNSDMVLSQLLYREHGFDVLLRTKHNAPSTSGDALKLLHEKYELEWLLDIKRYSDVSAMHNNFIRTYVEDWVKYDSRVHPKYNLHGTSSHRLSSSDPNLLNLPRGYYGYNIRKLYTVQGDMVFIAFDFSSCEVKILATLCKDEAMMKACEDKLDFHSFTASMMYGIPYEDIMHIKEDKDHPRHKEIKDLRQGAKAVTFGLLYGSSTNGIAFQLGKSSEEAQKIIDAYFNAFPKVKTFISDCHRMALENQYVFTPFGQRKMEYGAHEVFRGSASYNASKRNAQNVSIQSPASTLGLVVFAKLNEEVKKLGGRAICTVYDSIEIEVPISRMAEAIELGFYIMDDWPVEAFDWLDFPIGADGELGWTWGDVEEIHRGITQEECMKILADQDENRLREVLSMAA